MTIAQVPASDGDLLKQYAGGRDQQAFAQLVGRHIDWVYSTARRITRDDALAEDVAQGVFLSLSQKASGLAHHPCIAAWLFQATRFGAQSALQRECRRKRYEAMAQTPTPQATPDAEQCWRDIRDHLDRALSRLPAQDRQALLLRFYQQLSHGELAAALGVPEDAGRMRVARALAKLRARLGGGTDGLLSVALLAHATGPAPAHLAATILTGAPSVTALALSKSIHAAITTLKIKVVSVFTGAILLAMALGVTLQTMLAAAPAPVATPVVTSQPVTEPVAAMVAPAAAAWITDPPAPGQAFQGWVHFTETHANGSSPTIDYWNTKSGVEIYRREGVNDTAITLLDPVARECRDYSSQTGWMSINLISPDQLASQQEFIQRPLTYPEVLDNPGTMPGPDLIKITPSAERSMNRFDLALADPAKPLPRPTPWDVGSAFAWSVPSTFFVDPNTKLLREYHTDSLARTYTYGGPDIPSIYDAGVPRDAKIWDCRPSPQTRAVIQRLEARMKTSFPDGVAARLSITTTARNESAAGFDVYEISGSHRQSRGWEPRAMALADDAPGRLHISDNWADDAVGSVELFRHLVVAMPSRIFVSDGKTGWTAEIDPKTGAQFLSWGEIDLAKTPATGPFFPAPEIIRLSGGRQITGRKLQIAELQDSPSRQIYTGYYPEDEQYMPGHMVDLATDPARPGLVALHACSHGLSPDSLSEETYFWFDPAHDDRPVSVIRTNFRNPSKPDILRRDVVEFTNYATLPAPESRSYPTAWTMTIFTPDANGQLKPTGFRTTTTFHFFAGKTLPPLSKPTATEP